MTGWWCNHHLEKWWSESQWEGWHPIYIYIYPIYEMENNSHVWNHQPDMHLVHYPNHSHIHHIPIVPSYSHHFPKHLPKLHHVPETFTKKNTWQRNWETKLRNINSVQRIAQPLFSRPGSPWATWSCPSGTVAAASRCTWGFTNFRYRKSKGKIL